MKLLVSSCARLFKTPGGDVYTPVAYGYDFYKRYLNVFDEVCVLGFCDTIDETSAEQMLKVTGDGVSVAEITYPHGEWDYIRKKRKIVKEVNRIVDQSSAILLRVPETLCFIAMNRAIRKKIPFSIEVISDPLNLYTKATCKSKYRLVYKIWYYLQLRRASYYANGTSYVTQFELQRHYPPNLAKENHFTSFYTDTNISIPKDILPKKLPTEKKVRLLHISVLINGFAKGHKEAIECLSKLINSGVKAELVLVGDGELDKSNIEFINKNNLKDYIHFTGKLKTEQVIEELDKADIFLFPSYNEGLPRVVVEAMSRALPVIATDIPGHRELLDKEFLAPVKDSGALFDIAKKIIDNPEYYEAASQRNIEKAGEYDIEIIEKRRNSFYKKLYEIADKVGKND